MDAATNRYVGGDYTYNEIGAVKTGASYAFEYDALGQPLSKKYDNIASTQEYYLYTPGDERIGVQRGTWWTWSVRDEGGKVLRQYRGKLGPQYRGKLGPGLRSSIVTSRTWHARAFYPKRLVD